jgi:hypothetical protein
MKTFMVFMSLLLPSLSWSQENVKAVKNLIELYQDEAQTKTGHLLNVVFEEEERFQADAKIYENGAVIRIFAGMVKEFSPLELVTITCHEIGHILGEIREANNLIGGEVRTFREAVEGEADYFAGGCLSNYLEKNGIDSSATEIATSAYEKLLQQKVPLEPEHAKDIEVTGVLPSYPQPDCRLLSVLNGIERKDRPKCWYNPDGN